MNRFNLAVRISLTCIKRMWRGNHEGDILYRLIRIAQATEDSFGYLSSNFIVAIKAKSFCFGIPSLGGRFANYREKALQVRGVEEGESRRGEGNTSMNVDVTLWVPLGGLFAAL